MKKIISIVLVLFCLCACGKTNTNINNDERYYDLLRLLQSEQNFTSSSTYYDINVEIDQIDDAYRFYVIVDNPKIAMYNIQIMAIVEGDDYTNTMAANVGIFEDTAYNMVPNQTNLDKGYVKGLSISGLTNKENCKVKIIVRYQNEDLIDVYRDYYQIEASLKEE